MTKKKPRIETTVAAAAAVPSVSTANFYNWSRWALLVFGFLLYANTLGHDYTQDDAIVIYDNMYTTKGVSGIPGLLSKDTFFGFFKEEGKAKLVSGGRYRPLTPVMFALEYQIFGKNPFIGHCINALLYGLLGMMIFMLFTRIFSIRNDFEDHFKYVVLACSLLFIAHPVHTEAVANIKGRDEIMSMMGAVLATIFVLKNWTQYNVRNTWVAFGAFFLALMSKENAITFLAVVPAILWLFYASPFSRIFSLMLPLLGATIVFLIIRTAVLGVDLGGTPMELMNNPFLKLDGQQYVAFTFMEKSATIMYTLGKYLLLLIFPHPLTHDYYPRHIDIMSFSDPGVILSVFAYAAMFWALWFFYQKNRVVVFSIFFFLVTLSIVSNVVFPIGTNMSERFLFMPSLGFCLLIPEIIYAITKKGRVVLNICMIAVVAFALKTVTRNPVWKNDFTLFTTDVEVSKNSAKVLNAAGGALSTEAVK
ncbi:MAG: DUF1736 domain-containing protein [Saprospiraceae bacterium]|nr:DUF1736 domain-containing protein [Saprospiraceae bacterium]